MCITHFVFYLLRNKIICSKICLVFPLGIIFLVLKLKFIYLLKLLKNLLLFSKILMPQKYHSFHIIHERKNDTFACVTVKGLFTHFREDTTGSPFPLT